MDYTFRPNFKQIPDFSATTFWIQISSEDRYQSKALKASRILYPVLCIAHRLLASIVFPRHERSTVTTDELKFCMTRNLPIKRHLGAFICATLFNTSQANSGLIQCGGLVDLIASFDSISVTLDLFEQFSLDKSLTLDAYKSMHMSKQQEHGFLWTINPDTSSTVLINKTSTHYLELSTPIENTDWTLS